jgi:hypothetical protein
MVRRCVMSEADALGASSKGTTLERSRNEVLQVARPLPPDEDVLMTDLAEDEDRMFLSAILSA